LLYYFSFEGSIQHAYVIERYAASN